MDKLREVEQFDPKMDRTSPRQVVTEIRNTKEMLLHMLQYTICRTNMAAPKRRGTITCSMSEVKLTASAQREESASRLWRIQARIMLM